MAAADLKTLGRYNIERVLGKGETKSSVVIRGGYQADLRLVAPQSRGAAMQYFTGSKPHNIALRDRALQRGLKLNEYGIYRLSDDAVLAGEDEAGIYETLGLAWVPPELREHRGELEAAETRTLPSLVDLRDLRGDVKVPILKLVAATGQGVDDLVDAIEAHQRADTAERRAARARSQILSLAHTLLRDHSELDALAEAVAEGRDDPYSAAARLVEGVGVSAQS